MKCVYTKSTNISFSGFKVTLANSLLSYTTHSDSIFLENLPFHIRSDKGELKMEVFYDKFTDDDPFKQDQNKLDFFSGSSARVKDQDTSVLLHSQSCNYMVASGLRKVYDINSTIHRQAEKDEYNNVEFYKVEVPKTTLEEVFLKQMTNSVIESFKGCLKDARKVGSNILLKLYDHQAPDFLFSVWSVTKQLPTKSIRLFEEIYTNSNDIELNNPFYSLTYSEETLKEFSNYCVENFNVVELIGD